jgi:hypothetical protein
MQRAASSSGTGAHWTAAEIEDRKAHAFEEAPPGYVTIMKEMAHDAKIIPRDRRPHLDRRLRPGTTIGAGTGAMTRRHHEPPTSWVDEPSRELQRQVFA